MQNMHVQDGRKGSPPFRRLKPLPLVSLVSFVAVGLLIAWYFSPLDPQNSSEARNLSTVTGQLSTLNGSQEAGQADPNQPIKVVLGLKLRNQNELAQYVKSISHPQSQVVQTLTPAQIQKAYSPLPSSQQAVISYMEQQGFQTIDKLGDRTLISFTGTVGQAEQAFHVQINNYRSPKGQIFYAPTTDPRLPATLAPLVQNISGLDSEHLLSHPPIPQVNAHKLAQSSGQSNIATTGCPMTGPREAPTFYTPSQLASAYHIAPLHDAGFYGEGQSVGLIEFDDFSMSDIKTYTACYGGSAVPITRIPISGGAKVGDSADEVELDMETVLSTAPHLANLRVYEAPFDNNWQGNYLLAWAHAINDAVPVISTSWGTCEANLSPAYVQQENELLMLAAAQRQTVFASSGDYGSTDCQNSDPANTTLSVDDPASQPYVTGVGGTSLSLATGVGGTNPTLGTTSYGHEVAWNDSQNPAAKAAGSSSGSDSAPTRASGGGISSFWTMPDWQTAPGVTNTFSSATPCAQNTGNTKHLCREVPDVSLNADPYAGYIMYCTVGDCANKPGVQGIQGMLSVGGTSAAAPMWAAMTAISNQRSLYAGYFNLGFLNPVLYQIAQNPDSYKCDADHACSFHDIVDGSNNILGSQSYPATPGYDMATGLGSYVANHLSDAMINIVKTKTQERHTPASQSWFFAEGSVGGSFSEFLTILNPHTSRASDANGGVAHIKVSYLFDDGQPMIQKTHSIDPSNRATFSVNDDVGVQMTGAQKSVSMIISSDIPVVAERVMYFNFHGIHSGTDTLGATDATQTNYYFAEGDTRLTAQHDYSTYVTVLNPSASQSADVTVNFYANGKVVRTKTLQVGPQQRGTAVPDPGANQQMSIKVSANIGIVAERSVYFRDTIPTAGGMTSGATTTLGATSLGDTNGSNWLFADGFTGPGFQEYLVLANFSDADAPASIKLEYSNGQSQTLPVTIKAKSQLYFDVNQASAHPQVNCNCQSTNSVSAQVTSPTAAVMAERLMYFHFGGSNIVGGSDAAGVAGGHSSYSFAEGFIANGFYEFLSLQNPTDKPVDTVVTVYTVNTLVQKTIQLRPFSNTTLDIKDMVAAINQAYGGDFEVSMSVQALNGSIVAERTIYFNFLGSTGGTAVPGLIGD